MKLNDAIKNYKNVLTKKDCSSITQELKFVKWDKHSFVNPQTNKRDFKENYCNISTSVLPSNNFLMKTLWETVHRYISDLNFFWYKEWNGYSAPRYNHYLTNYEMKKHCDHIHSLFEDSNKGVPVLSIVGLLNENFEGGDFLINGKRINLEIGDILIFPSNFMYPHEVRKITAGERYSFVSWVW